MIKKMRMRGRSHLKCKGNMIGYEKFSRKPRREMTPRRLKCKREEMMKMGLKRRSWTGSNSLKTGSRG
jgi:hypothetical protein